MWYIHVAKHGHSEGASAMPTAEGTKYPAASPPLMPFFFPRHKPTAFDAGVLPSLENQGFFRVQLGEKMPVSGRPKCTFRHNHLRNPLFMQVSGFDFVQRLICQ